MQGRAADLKKFGGLANIIATQNKSLPDSIFLCRLTGFL
jgi:hypothetical protein